ncbi:MAG: mandelate racemase/muconate lactonizing enzyme family protein [Pirellulales bacterium]|nr:mandelate racemase/muconate lactonizing enzyme family protein [Pirellulales bacterium]
MKIHDLEFFAIPPEQNKAFASPSSLLVRATTASGLEGWGESALVWRSGELSARRESLLAVLAGQSIYDIEELHGCNALSPPPVRAAVEMAVWDLLGRALRQPLCNLLGGYYRRRIPVSVRLSGCDSKTASKQSRELIEQGFHTLTVVSEGRADDDLRSIRAIRELLGEGATLRLDGQGLFDAETARDLCAELEYEGLQYFLDPIETKGVHATAVLGRQTSVPLALWKSMRDPADVFCAARCSAASFVVIELDQVGGIVPARACAAVAAAGGVVPVLGCRTSLGIATAAMLHLAAATPNFSTANEIAPRQLRDNLLVDPPEIVEGMITVPELHGLGVEVDRDKLERRQPLS